MSDTGLPETEGSVTTKINGGLAQLGRAFRLHRPRRTRTV